MRSEAPKRGCAEHPEQQPAGANRLVGKSTSQQRDARWIRRIRNHGQSATRDRTGQTLGPYRVLRLLGAGGELGKRLDFLIQELQREANTLGSKSAALELTTISVEMKVLVEQMREQVQNIE